MHARSSLCRPPVPASYEHCFLRRGPPTAACSRLPPCPLLRQVRMLLGVLPSVQLLQQYGLPEYLDVRTAVASGDLAMLLACLEVGGWGGGA